MTELMLKAAQIAVLLACIVVVSRCVMVVDKLLHSDRGGQPWWAWTGFGLSYCLLATGTLGGTAMVWAENPQIGYAPIVLASAGLILFDRRRRGRRKPAWPVPTGANDPQQTVLFETFAPTCANRLGAFCRHRDHPHPFRMCEQRSCPIMNAATSAQRRSA